jgi:hypothetical protein
MPIAREVQHMPRKDLSTGGAGGTRSAGFNGKPLGLPSPDHRARYVAHLRAQAARCLRAASSIEDRAYKAALTAMAAELAAEADELATDAPEKPGMAQRRAARNGLRVLVALARSDGTFRKAKVWPILEYIEVKAGRAGIPTSEADRAALEEYILRQRPRPQVVERCLQSLQRQPYRDRRLLVDCAVRIIDADGERHPAELAFFELMKQRLIGRHTRPGTTST